MARSLRVGTSALAIALLAAGPALAQVQTQPAPNGEGAADAGTLALKLANPLSDLTNVPFQENLEFGMGPTGKGVRSSFHLQPIVPFSLSPGWRLISRTIVPLVNQYDVTAPGASEFGLNDLQEQLFFSPKQDSGFIWGVGPIVTFPTGSTISSGQWAAGPNAVALYQSAPHTMGVLANHVVGFNHPTGAAPLNQTFLQPFYSYTTPFGFTGTLQSETSYHWGLQQLTLPVIAQVGQVVQLGGMPINVVGGLKYYVASPPGGPQWGARVMAVLLFPK